MDKDEIEKKSLGISIAHKILWGVVGILCIINLYIFLILVIKIGFPEFAAHYTKNELVRIGILAVAVLFVKAVTDNLVQKKLIVFIGFNFMLLFFNIFSILKNWFSL